MPSTAPSPGRSRPRTAIIGAGIIGLSIGFELAVRRGAAVTLYETGAPGQGASWAAAGMIAPAFEAAGEAGAHARLLDLCLESAALWPGFAADIEAASGLAAGYAPAPALAAAMEAREQARLEAIGQTLASRGLAHRILGGAELRRAEPALSRHVLGGLELSTDTRVDNRRTVAALIRALEASPLASFRRGPAPLRSAGDRVTLEGHDAVIAAAGWQTPMIRVEDAGGACRLVDRDAALGDIEGYGGQILSVAAGAGAPTRVVRSGDVYLVPRGGQIVIGATLEPFVVPDVADEAATEALRRAAIALCPGLEGAKVTGRWAGVRPGTPDHAPFLGETAAPGLFVAAGHYRNGILLAPVTAQVMADLITGRAAGELAATFSPRRAAAATA